jgi:RimJ/RimL family protein N-acetyltransferase
MLTVSLRDVEEADLPIFFEQQRDPEAVAMADFPSRELGTHLEHWHKIMADKTNTLKTILADGQVAGNVVSWDHADQREVGYWLGREFWGRGIATRALGKFLAEEMRRPLFAYVAKHNHGSRRVLEKCGFSLIGADGTIPENATEPVAEFIFRLD